MDGVLGLRSELDDSGHWHIESDPIYLVIKAKIGIKTVYFSQGQTEGESLKIFNSNIFWNYKSA